MRTCHFQQTTNLVFIKVHKCASSSVANAIVRFGLENQLNIGLPKYERGHIGWPRKFSSSDVDNVQQDQPVNILTHHLVYDAQELKKFMPRGTRYVAILRDPFEQFKSTMNYFHELRQLDIADPHLRVQTFLSDPAKFERKIFFKIEGRDLGYKSLTRNFMSTDLGMPEKYFDNPKLVADYIRYLDRNLDLVLISEYFNVSMVMLRRLLGWSLSDVVTMTINYKSRTQWMDDENALREKHKTWSLVDYKLYDYFNNTFWLKVAQQGEEGILAEARHLEKLNRLFLAYCLQRKDRGFYILPASRWNGPARITSKTCELAQSQPYILTGKIRQYMLGLRGARQKMKNDFDRNDQ